MTTRTKYNAGVQTFYEDIAFETVMPMAPLRFEADFLGAGALSIAAAGTPTIGSPWCQKIVGLGPPTVGGIANASGGIVQAALTITSEKQDAVLYWNDSRGLDVTKGLIFECRAALTVAPSAAGVQAVWGVAAAWIDGPDNNTQYLEFGCTASNALLIRSRDGTTQNSIAAAPIGGTAVTLDTSFHQFRIDATKVTDVVFYYDGNRVNAVGSISFAATGANAILQPYLAVYKASGTGVATLQADVVRAWSNR